MLEDYYRKIVEKDIDYTAQNERNGHLQGKKRIKFWRRMPGEMTKYASIDKKTMSECFGNFYWELDTHSKSMAQIMSIITIIQPFISFFQNKNGGFYQA